MTASTYRALWFDGEPWCYREVPGVRYEARPGAAGGQLIVPITEPGAVGFEGAPLGQPSRGIADPMLLDAIREDRERAERKA